VDLTAAEIRVLGCLLEKERTTPDAYPLTLNALRAACNQSTNRDPVVSYDDAIIRDALTRLSRRRWARLAGAARAAKYRHLLDEALPLSAGERAVLTVLMLRGPQTPGELKQRTERMHAFADLAGVFGALESLAARELAAQLPRRPGEREERYTQLLGEDAPQERAAPAPAAPAPAAHEPAPAAAPEPPPADDGRLERLEREVARLRADFDALRAELGEA
jgi:uncharacterized protein YceH (UPF0502 family)